MKKVLSLLLLLLIVAFANTPALAGGRQQQSATKIKQKISKLGLDTAVIVKLDDGRKLGGRIVEKGEDSFVLLVPVKGDSTAKLTNRIVIAYSVVKQVKYDGPSGANLGPAILLSLAVILLLKLIH